MKSASWQAERWYCVPERLTADFNKSMAPCSLRFAGGCPSMHLTLQLWRASSSPGHCNQGLPRQQRGRSTHLSPRRRQSHRMSGLCHFYGLQADSVYQLQLQVLPAGGNKGATVFKTIHTPAINATL
ncbi:hypothetical protein KUCAC02_022450 [Chaenocephalus aceratus]|uniref:Uncharacterized protein n=1 Tax=Chaenocephalus aceratus TaxID=36190 RepID=A0ACB9XP37_CHAAC|nr:hypothetical protein KUCAC02_022450 [Chaenocephalus aceratus]